MNSAEFRRVGKILIDYIADYHDNIRQRRVTSRVEPGYLRPLIEQDPPQKGESWDDIMEEIETKIIPGITHWTHPHFYAYFPIGSAYASILGEMLTAALATNGFSWVTSPAVTELETIVLDWVGKMIGLPIEFLYFTEGSSGGAVIQSSASECVFLCMVAARNLALKNLKRKTSTTHKKSFLRTLVAYCSNQAHSCVEKAASLGLVNLRILDTDEDYQLRGQTLADAIEEDKKKGYNPFFVMATLGTTGPASCDVLAEIGPVCEQHDLWLHIDAAYAGTALICPEFRPFSNGVSYARSINSNPSKWMLVNSDCSILWVKDRLTFTDSFIIEAQYLQHDYSAFTINYRNWGVSLSRRFRSLKLWATIKNYGVEAIQEHVRHHCKLAKIFENLVREDDRFEVKNVVWFSLVCFKLKGSNNLNQRFMRMLNHSGLLFVIPTMLRNEFVIRFCVNYQYAVKADIVTAWGYIQRYATEVLESANCC